jgi:hypothetical protein
VQQRFDERTAEPLVGHRDDHHHTQHHAQQQFAEAAHAAFAQPS